MKNLKSIERLTEAFAKLPGIGHKSAEKMAYSILEMEEKSVHELSNALVDVKENIHHCKECGAYCEGDLCEICSDSLRDKSKIIVVSYPRDIFPFERLGTYDGVYHVLGGVLSAVNGVSVEDLAIEALLDKVSANGVKEVIIATNPTVEGETTALYIAKILENMPVNVTRIAYGLPMGGHLEYTDSLTLLKSLEGRKKI